jgi:hypothetical protein
MGASGKLLTVEDCRGKAAECLRTAETITDPQTQATFRRAAGAWMALAQQIDQHPLRLPNLLEGRLPSSAMSGVRVADILRERLYLSPGRQST